MGNGPAKSEAKSTKGVTKKKAKKRGGLARRGLKNSKNTKELPAREGTREKVNKRTCTLEDKKS